MTETQTPTEAEMLAGIKATLTLMTATRLATGLTPDASFCLALASFVKMCEQRP